MGRLKGEGGREGGEGGGIAIALLVLALVPVLFVDTLVNGEIEG